MSIRLPAIGQGMGEYSWDESQIEVLRTGIDLGMNFIDTAEIYDNGRSERIIGEAIKGLRKKVIIGTKVAPQHHAAQDVIKAAEGSLRRLQTDYIDLYQIHWPNPVFPLEETMSAMEHLVREGKVRYIGVCNFYLRELQEAQSGLSFERTASLQTEYNLFDRMIEDTILPYCSANNILIIAYSPLDQGRIADGAERRKLIENTAKKYGKTPAQIALRWLINNPTVVVIPKAKNLKHLLENAQSCDFDLDVDDIEKIDNVFKRPIVKILPDRIRVSREGQGNRPVYQTIEQAIENNLGHVPSPVNLAKSIVKEECIKPVRLIPALDETGRYDHDLVEGRIRYWAWVIAYGNKPIQAYIREDRP